MVRYVVNQHMLLIRYVAKLIYFTGKASLKNDDINGKICSKTIYLVIKKAYIKLINLMVRHVLKIITPIR